MEKRNSNSVVYFAFADDKCSKREFPFPTIMADMPKHLTLYTPKDYKVDQIIE